MRRFIKLPGRVRWQNWRFFAAHCFFPPLFLIGRGKPEMLLSHYHVQRGAALKVSYSLMLHPGTSQNISSSLLCDANRSRGHTNFLYCSYVINMISLYKFIMWRLYVRCVIFSWIRMMIM